MSYLRRIKQVASAAYFSVLRIGIQLEKAVSISIKPFNPSIQKQWGFVPAVIEIGGSLSDWSIAQAITSATTSYSIVKRGNTIRVISSKVTSNANYDKYILDYKCMSKVRDGNTKCVSVNIYTHVNQQGEYTPDVDDIPDAVSDANYDFRYGFDSAGDFCISKGWIDAGNVTKFMYLTEGAGIA